MTLSAELRHWGHHEMLCHRLDALNGYVVGASTCIEQHTHVLFSRLDVEWFRWYSFDDLHEPTEIELMQALGSIGHPRCAISTIKTLQPRLFLVEFNDTSLSDPEIPEVGWHVLSIPLEPSISTHARFSQRLEGIAENGQNHNCLLTAPAGADTIRSIFDTAGCLQRDPQDIPFHPRCLEAITQASNTGLTHFDRIRIYTDGSSNPAYKHWEPELVLREGTPDAWAFVVLGETCGDPEEPPLLTLIGYATQPISYEKASPYYIGAERIGSDIAEREALFWAGLWRLAYDVTTPTVFLTDSVTAGKFAFGQCGTTTQGPAEHHALTRGVYQALEAALPKGGLQLQHVPGHSGEVWNECCDTLAKWSAGKVHWLPRQAIDMHLLRPVLPVLWMYLSDESAGLPPKTNDGHFCVDPPALPGAFHQGRPKSTTTTTDTLVTLSLATANVQTLGAGPQGYQGKLHYLQQQFREYEVHAIGIQEARTEEIFSGKRADYLRLASGHERGHLGVELWLSRTIPYAWIGRTPCYFEARHLVVLHKDPRRLVVRATAPGLDCIFVVLHGPQSGRQKEEREEWWVTTTDLLLKYTDTAPIFVLGDLNATTGPKDDYHVQIYDDVASTNTSYVRDMVQHLDLVFASTMSCHYGPHGTWRSPDGQYERRIDHILIPSSLGHSCMFTTVMRDWDLGNGDTDHQPLGAMLQWMTTATVTDSEKAPKTCPRHLIRHNDCVKRHLQDYVTPPWHCNIAQHVDGFNDCINHALTNTLDTCTTSVPGGNPRRKPFMTDEIWKLRSSRTSSSISMHVL